MSASNDVNADVDVIVVGAGIAGVVAARELQRRGHSTLVLEKEEHTGGRIQTERREYGYLEHGGIFHTQGYPATRRLIDELGLGERVLATPTGFSSAVRVGHDWKHVNYGSVTGPLRFSGLGWRDRLSILRAALPGLAARPTDLGDLTELRRLDTRSAAAGLTPRAEYYFTAGPHEFLWGTPTAELSYAMLALQLHVFRGELREIRGGSGQLVDQLAEDVEVRHCCAAKRVNQEAGGVEVRSTGLDPLRARAVVLACPADVSAELWPDSPTAVREHLTSVTYSRIDYVYLKTTSRLSAKCEGRPVGMEVVTTPEIGNRTLGGIYYANDWVDDGGLLLVTAAPAAHAENLDDDELADRLHAEAAKLHPELSGQVIDRVAIRHEPYTPKFTPHCLSRLATARQALPAGRIDLAGDHMTAPWVEGAVRSGQQAAERVSRTLR